MFVRMSGSRGPKSKPTAVKKHEGTWRPRDGEDEIMENLPAMIEIPDAPDTLGDRGVFEWNRICAETIEVPGWLVKSDLIFLEQHCILYEMLMETVAYMKKAAYSFKSSAFNDYLKLFKLYAQSCASFGLTPSDRTRINLAVGMGQKINNELEML